MSILTRRLAALTDPQQFRLVPRGDGAVLDLGCGRSKFPGAVGAGHLGRHRRGHRRRPRRLPLPDRERPPSTRSCARTSSSTSARRSARWPSSIASGGRVHASLSAPRTSRPCWPTAIPRTATTSPPRPSEDSRSLASQHYTAARFRVVELTLDSGPRTRLLGVAAIAKPPRGPLRALLRVPLPRP